MRGKRETGIDKERESERNSKRERQGKAKEFLVFLFGSDSLVQFSLVQFSHGSVFSLVQFSLVQFSFWFSFLWFSFLFGSVFLEPCFSAWGARGCVPLNQHIPVRAPMYAGPPPGQKFLPPSSDLRTQACPGMPSSSLGFFI